jgi:hypothetical protein
MLTLDEKDLQQLNLFIQEMPLKHGLPLLNFINGKIQEQINKEIPQELKTEESNS